MKLANFDAVLSKIIVIIITEIVNSKRFTVYYFYYHQKRGKSGLCGFVCVVVCLHFLVGFLVVVVQEIKFHIHIYWFSPLIVSETMMRFVGGRIPVRMFSAKTRVVPKDVAALPEIIQREKMLQELQHGKLDFPITDTMIVNYMKAGICDKKSKMLVDAALSTFLLHCEARIASSRGKGFYTIGPCGEEILAGIGLCLQDTDASALHYRHVAAEVARNLQSGVPLEDILLDRARGYTCSVHDPVTGGKHCAIGGNKFSYMVTSTLSSQAPPAVGRALAIPLAHKVGASTKFAPGSVSLVTVGDGSINNAHFLSAINIAQYAKHTKMKVCADIVYVSCSCIFCFDNVVIFCISAVSCCVWYFR